MKTHPSHDTRVSMDASTYDEICSSCGATDTRGSGLLGEPCPGFRAATFLIVKLPACEASVPDGGRPDGTSACGEPATYRVSWDDGRTWLCACNRHAGEAEMADLENYQ